MTCFLSLFEFFFFLSTVFNGGLLLPHPCLVLVIYFCLCWLPGWLGSLSVTPGENCRCCLMLPHTSLFVCLSSCFWSSSTVLLILLLLSWRL